MTEHLESASQSSGVAKLGHTGAHALATRDCAPPVQACLKIIGTKCTVVNCELGAKMHKGVEIEQNNRVSLAPLISMYVSLP